MKPFPFDVFGGFCPHAPMKKRLHTGVHALSDVHPNLMPAYSRNCGIDFQFCTDAFKLNLGGIVALEGATY